MGLTLEQIAGICYAANRAYCKALGDDTQLPWNEALARQRRSAIDRVVIALHKPDATPEYHHNEWLREKEAGGWRYGPVEDATKREHPCMVLYDSLPAEQRRKYHMFMGIVRALTWPTQTY